MLRVRAARYMRTKTFAKVWCCIAFWAMIFASFIFCAMTRQAGYWPDPTWPLLPAALIDMKNVTRVLRYVITLPGLKAGIVVSQFDKVLLPKMKEVRIHEVISSSLKRKSLDWAKHKFCQSLNCNQTSRWHREAPVPQVHRLHDEKGWKLPHPPEEEGRGLWYQLPHYKL